MSVFYKKDNGQGMVEYGLILALISAVTIGALGGIGDGTNKGFDKVSEPDIIAKIDRGFIPIASADELNYIREEKARTFGKGTSWEGTYTAGLDKSFIQVTDIDLSTVDEWEPIDAFTGTYEGSGLSIKNLSLHSGNHSSAGLFGEVQGAILKNIRLEDVSIRGTGAVGGLSGRVTKDSILSDIFVSGDIRHLKSNNGEVVGLGGIAGVMSDHSQISTSHVDATMIGQENVGGLVGHSQASLINQSYAQGTLSGTKSVGGLVGLAESKSSVNQSYADVEISGTNQFIGGLIGNDGGVVVDQSHWDIDSSGQKETAGDKGFGHPSFDMTLARTFDDWDFERVWSVDEGKTSPSFNGENSRLDNVNVTFIADDDTTSVVIGLVGASLNDYSEGDIPSPKKGGYTFEGWETEAGKPFDLDTKLGDKDLTIVPIWKSNVSVSKTFYLTEEEYADQIKSITIDNLYDVVSYEVDKGSIELLDRKGESLEFKLTNRPYDRRAQTGGVETLEDSKVVTAQHSNIYNSDGYEGTLTRYVYSGSYSPADSKFVSGQSSSSYNSGGYSGTLSSYLAGGSGSDSKYVSGESSSYYNSGGYSGTLSSYVYGSSPSHSKTETSTSYGSYDDLDNIGIRGYPSKSMRYNSGGYSGTLSLSSVSENSMSGIPGGYRVNYSATYSGTVTRPGSTIYKYRGTVNKPDTRYYRYEGTVSKPSSDTRTYRYQGTVTRPYSDTRTWDHFYKYAVTVTYREK